MILVVGVSAEAPSGRMAPLSIDDAPTDPAAITGEGIETDRVPRWDDIGAD